MDVETLASAAVASLAMCAIRASKASVLHEGAAAYEGYLGGDSSSLKLWID